MDTIKVYCCIPVKFKDDDKIHYEIETVKNYYLAFDPSKKDSVEFVSNFVEDGNSRNYSLNERDFKNAGIDELAKAIERLKDCNVVVFYPTYEADDACKIIEQACSMYQYKTKMIKMNNGR